MPDLPPRPVLDGTAEIDAELYGSWAAAKIASDHFAEQARGHEVLIREQAGNARYLAVNGQRVAVRIIQDAVNVSFRKDFYRRIGTPAMPAAPPETEKTSD